LLAVIVGDNFFLAPADRELTFGAVGGQGGTGGTGGYGGNGGEGGQGGQGGRGGTVNVTYDSRFSELRGLIATDVHGGAGGYGGGPGGGGNGGGSTAQEEAAGGNGGGLGQAGGDGSVGDPGRANVRAGSVSNMFTRFPGIAVFGTPEAQRIQAATPAPAEKTISSKRRPK